MIKYLNHELANSPIENFPNDLVCIKCGIRLEPGKEKKYNLVKNYIPGKIAGELDKNYILTCEEQIIKNLLE